MKNKELMSKDELLAKAIDIAREAHQGQVDKSGADYIEHPIRVAEGCKTADTKMVAMLHDTIEDSYITPAYLLDAGFPQHIVDAVISVTKKHGEDYMSFIRRVRNNLMGRNVKIYDILDNLDLKRLEVVTLKDVERSEKYLKALKVLIS